jgi:8-oxo-dGTP pyrophosphatase MutT (NUDIX family)
MPVEISAGAVIFRMNASPKFLILHYEKGHWDFAKGNVEKGEEEVQTVLREIEEETGIKYVKILEGFREKISYFYRKGKKTVYKEVVFYLAETKTKEVEISYEHVGYAWLGYEEALERLTFENAKKILEKAKNFLEERRPMGL